MKKLLVLFCVGAFIGAQLMALQLGSGNRYSVVQFQKMIKEFKKS